MTVKGDNIIMACPLFFSEEGISVRLEPGSEGNVHVCPRNQSHRFAVENGMLKRLK
ncbi:MAG: hypothetical protein AB1468_06900 [Candidatus Micrarchaeota archaeon]